jgi:flagellar operon protein
MIGPVKVDGVPAVNPQQAPPAERAARAPETAFDAALDGAFADHVRTEQDAPPPTTPVSSEPVTFSRHAEARLQSRNIELSETEQMELSDAVDKLQERGAQESLVLMDDHAFIVGVPKRTVITAMTRQEAVGNLFTNIDSTLVIR